MEIPPSREKYLIQQSKRMGQPVPDKILNKPSIGTGLLLYYDAFLKLQGDRNKSGYIPWSVKIQYADRYRLSEYQTDMLIFLLSALDECHAKWL